MSTATTATTATIDLRELLSVVIDLAKKGGDAIYEVRHSGSLGTREKTPGDPVTRADYESQKIIVGTLMHLYPGLRFINEEDISPDTYKGVVFPTVRKDIVPESRIPEKFRSLSLEDVTVIVDPLDATKEFTKGTNEPIMVLVGIAYKGVPIAGVTHQPFVDVEHGGRTVTGVVGGTPAVTGAVPRVRGGFASGDVVLVSGPFKAHAELCRRLGARVEFHNGCGNKMMHILEGKGDIYVRWGPGTKLWDTCAGQAIITAAGGRVTDQFGKDIPYFWNSEPSNKNGVCVTMENHDEVIAKLNAGDAEIQLGRLN